MLDDPTSVVPVAEARAGLSSILRSFRVGSGMESVIIGSHRKPEAVLIPFAAYERAAEASQVPSLDRLRSLAPIIRKLAGLATLRDVRVFGSVARGDATRDSDIDLLVSPGPETTLFDIAEFELDMETLLGFPVSAVPATALDRERDARILRESVPL